MRARCDGWDSLYLEQVGSYESYPRDFDAFVVRLGKFAGGSAELLCGHLPCFLLCRRATVAERLDALVIMLSYALMAMLIINGLLGAYVSHRLWSLDIVYFHPALPHIFVAMFLATAAVMISVVPDLPEAASYWAWSAAIYLASLPLAAGQFLIHLVTPPRFEPTPKPGSPRRRSRKTGLVSAAVVALGTAALGLSARWWSPFSPMLAAYGAAFVSFPLYRHLDRNSALGVLARGLVWVPGALLIAALYMMWTWGRY